MPIDDKQARQPWEQRDNESQQAFRAFVFYRDLGLERSLTRAYRASVGDEAGEKYATGTWDKWSSENEWVERCRAYDAHMDSIRREAREREAADLDARRWAFERENQGLLENWVRNLDEKLWRTLQDGFTEVKEEFTKNEAGQLVVVKRETKVRFPALGSFARLLEARHDTGRQAVEGPRRKPEIALSGAREASADKTAAPGTPGSGPNEFVWIAPPTEEQLSGPMSKESPETSRKGD